MQTVFILSRKIPLVEKETPLNLSNFNLKVLYKKNHLSSAFKEYVPFLNQIENLKNFYALVGE